MAWSTEILIKPRGFLDCMKDNCGITLAAGRVALLLALLINGCAHLPGEKPVPPDISMVELEQWRHDFKERIRQNPCGAMTIQPPFINVTGRFTNGVRHNTALFLFLTRNTTYENATYVLNNCAAIRRGRLENGTRFSFGLLPAGKYVAMVVGQGDRGFPVFDEIMHANLTVDTAFHYDNSSHSIAAFSVRRIEKGGNG